MQLDKDQKNLAKPHLSSTYPKIPQNSDVIVASDSVSTQ